VADETNASGNLNSAAANSNKNSNNQGGKPEELDPNFDEECLALMKSYELELQQQQQQIPTMNNDGASSNNIGFSESQYDELDDDDMNAAYYREREDEEANMLMQTAETNYDEENYEYVDDPMDEYS
jgi:hypothetical protein